MLIPRIPEVNRKPQAAQAAQAGAGPLSAGSQRASAMLGWRYRFVLLYAFPGHAFRAVSDAAPRDR
jgi:hypothetical protein